VKSLPISKNLLFLISTMTQLRDYSLSTLEAVSAWIMIRWFKTQEHNLNKDKLLFCFNAAKMTKINGR